MAPHPIGPHQLGGAILEIKGDGASLPGTTLKVAPLQAVFLPCLFSMSQLFLSLPGIPMLTLAWAQETVAAPCSGIGTLVHCGVEPLPIACAICPCCPSARCWAVLRGRGQHRDLHEKQQLDPAIRLTPAAGKGWVNRPRPWVASFEQVTAGGLGWSGERGIPACGGSHLPTASLPAPRAEGGLGGTYLDERAWTAAGLPCPGWGWLGAPHGAVLGPTHLPRAGSAAPSPFPATAGSRGAVSRRSNKRCEERRRRE